MKNIRLRYIIISFLMITLGYKNAFPQLSWQPKPKAGFKISGGGLINCGWIVNYFDTSVIINSCNALGDSCDSITEWYWKFGNGESSKLQNPVKNYRLGPHLENSRINVTLVIKTKYGFRDSILYPIYLAEPDALFKVKGDTIVQVGDPVRFENLSSIYFNPRWEWNFGDGNIFTVNFKNQPEVVHTYLTPGRFEVNLKMEDTINFFNTQKICKDIFPDTVSNEKKVVLVVIKPLMESNYSIEKIIIYPNPAKDYIQIKGIDNGEMKVYDHVGRKVLKVQIYKETADISALNKGIYRIQILKEGYNHQALFIKE